MEITKVLLKNMAAGDLQNLAYDLLPLIYEDWESELVHSGICEGGSRTRKGTPDIWGKRVNKSLVYIQATGDSKKGKMFEDLKKSVDKLVSQQRNQGAFCISFLNYEPQPEEVIVCEKYCLQHNCEFEFYTCSRVTELLEEKYTYLSSKYLGYPNKQIDEFTSNILVLAQSGQKFNQILHWNLNDEDLKATMNDVNQFALQLAELPHETRQLYCEILKRGNVRSTFYSSVEVLSQEIKQVIKKDDSYIKEVMDIMDDKGFGEIDIDEWEGKVRLVIIAKDISWGILGNLKEFAEMTGTNLVTMIVDLDFSVLD